MKNHRLARVSEAIREVASEAILFELRDPRIKFTTVTRAEVSPDLQRAKVYVSVMGSDKDRQLTIKGLQHAAGFVQSRLGDRMKTRFIPVLEFILDEGMKNSFEVNRLLSQERKLDQQVETEEEVSEDDSELDTEDALEIFSDHPEEATTEETTKKEKPGE